MACGGNCPIVNAVRVAFGELRWQRGCHCFELAHQLSEGLCLIEGEDVETKLRVRAALFAIKTCSSVALEEISNHLPAPRAR